MTAKLVTCVRDPRLGKVHVPGEKVECKGYLTLMEHKQMIRARFEDGAEILLNPDEIEEDED